MITFTDDQLLRLEAIRQEAKVHFKAIEELEEKAYKITGEADHNGHTTDLLYQSDMTVEELVKRLGAGDREEDMTEKDEI